MAGSSERVNNFRFQKNSRSFFYLLRDMTYLSDTLILGVGYIQNFTVNVPGACKQGCSQYCMA
jgi:hypothetical protein